MGSNLMTERKGLKIGTCYTSMSLSASLHRPRQKLTCHSASRVEAGGRGVVRRGEKVNKNATFVNTWSPFRYCAPDTRRGRC